MKLNNKITGKRVRSVLIPVLLLALNSFSVSAGQKQQNTQMSPLHNNLRVVPDMFSRATMHIDPGHKDAGY
jgi:hypothetical protein